MDKRRVKVVVMIKRVAIVGASVVLALYTCGLFREEPEARPAPDPRLWDQLMENYGVPFGEFCISWLYRSYLKCTVINVLVFSTKYLPTGLYLYTFIKGVYRSSSERLKIKQVELEDIVLQIAIVETKQCVRETECAEFAAQVQRESARLRAVRARVHEAIAADDALRATLDQLERAQRDDALDDTAGYDDTDLKSKCLVDLLKDMSYDKNGFAGKLNEVAECGEPSQFEPSENSEYSSLSEVDGQKDCRIKIIKVTNVYKVAYLKHYIKQKRLRRASKQAILKKKMESIKKLLENWQKSLNLVINDKLCMLEGREETSEEAMGDCSKLRDSDTDSELRASADTCADEFSPVWDHNAPFNYYQDPETSESRENFESHEYTEKFYGNYYEELELMESSDELDCYKQRECSPLLPLPRLLEETSSQLLAVQDTKLDHNDPADRYYAA